MFDVVQLGAAMTHSCVLRVVWFRGRLFNHTGIYIILHCFYYYSGSLSRACARHNLFNAVFLICFSNKHLKLLRVAAKSTKVKPSLSLMLKYAVLSMGKEPESMTADVSTVPQAKEESCCRNMLGTYTYKVVLLINLVSSTQNTL